MLFGLRVNQLRNQSGLSLHELASRSGLRTTYLSKIEAGEEIPTCLVLETLSQALQVPLYRLFYDRQPPPTPWLTPRLSLEEYFDKTAGLHAKPRLRETVRLLYSSITSLLLRLV
jgi:transcriptional regulator with XRE-family HTH domain